jgi:predicted  nucleic acid-binding Zn-ribbon protein
MGILQQIRTKFGGNSPDSVALTQAGGDLDTRMIKNRADAATIEASIPGAVIASIDGAATERRKLQALDSEYGALVKAADAIRREIAAAIAREAAAELQAREEKLQPLVDAYDDCARKLADARRVVADLDDELRRRGDELRLNQSVVHDFRLHVNALHKPDQPLAGPVVAGE